MNAALCPRCCGRNPDCPLCKGRGIFDASNPATIPMLGEFSWGSLGDSLANMGKSVVSNLTSAFPNIASSLISNVVGAKLAEKLGGGGGTGTASAKPATAPAQAAPAKAAPAGTQAATAGGAGALPVTAGGQIVYMIPGQQQSAAVPSWLLPAGLAVGGLVVAASLYLALRRKATP